ncbi:MAG: hypothetical protein U1E65_29235 [Myxococcota bacterium]
MRSYLAWIWIPLGISCAGSASTDAGAHDDAGAQDAGAADAQAMDADEVDAQAMDAAAADAGSHAGPYGFTIRVPQMRTIPCEGMFCGGTTTVAPDKDFVCALDHGAVHASYLYVAARPQRMSGFTGLIFSVDAAYLSDGTTPRAVTAIYDWGGNHNNDAITLSLTDASYKFSHSSFGFGFRKCQPMDCLQVYAPGASTPTEDGCTHDRTIPTVCVEVGADGTVPPLVDNFMRCPGDPG